MKRLLTTLLIMALVPVLHAQELRFDKVHFVADSWYVLAIQTYTGP